MRSGERLLAWLEPAEGQCLASFVAEAAAQWRAPASRNFASSDEARQWVMNEADAIHAPVEWIVQGAVPAHAGQG